MQELLILERKVPRNVLVTGKKYMFLWLNDSTHRLYECTKHDRLYDGTQTVLMYTDCTSVHHRLYQYIHESTKHYRLCEYGTQTTSTPQTWRLFTTDCMSVNTDGTIVPTENTERQEPLSGVHSIMMEKLTQSGEGGGCTPTPFPYIYYHVQSCSERSSWVRRYTHPISSLLIVCTLWLYQTRQTVRVYTDCTSGNRLDVHDRLYECKHRRYECTHRLYECTYNSTQRDTNCTNCTAQTNATYPHEGGGGNRCAALRGGHSGVLPGSDLQKAGHSEVLPGRDLQKACHSEVLPGSDLQKAGHSEVLPGSDLQKAANRDLLACQPLQERTAFTAIRRSGFFTDRSHFFSWW